MEEKQETSLGASMLQKLMENLPGFTTKCSTAQLKTIQHNHFDIPSEYWCCWVIDSNGKKHFAMFDLEQNKVKTISIDKKNSLIVKPVK